MDSEENNIFLTSSVNFEYRESGDYNDLIMMLLNEVLVKVDTASVFDNKDEGLTNYKDF